MVQADGKRQNKPATSRDGYCQQGDGSTIFRKQLLNQGDQVVYGIALYGETFARAPPECL